MHKSNALLIPFVCLLAQAQNSLTVSQVINQSLVTKATGTPTVSGNLFGVYTTAATANPANANFGTIVTTPTNYGVAASFAAAPLTTALAQNISVALSLIPLSSPSSGVILKKDPATGADLPVNGTLGPIFTQRAESIGKGKFYLGLTHQNFHFTSFNGQSLNGLSILNPGGDSSGVINPSTGQPSRTAATTFNLGMDVRVSQDVAFLTYGVTNKLDVSLGLPMVHSGVTATAFNGIVYTGTGADFNTGNQCWCINTLTPGTPILNSPLIGAASAAKTGFGDMIVRAKDTVIERPNIALALGVDIRFPTGDQNNFQGTGAYLLKPFMALSLYSKPLYKGIVFAPHFDFGFQGALSQSASVAAVAVQTPNGVPVITGGGSAFGKVPNVLSWGAGTEVAFGRHITLIADILGNQLFNAASLRSQNLPTGLNAPSGAFTAGPVTPQSSGLVNNGLTSFGQYNGAFGFKAKVVGNLVATFQMLIRFDNNGLTARATPLYGLGYSF